MAAINYADTYQRALGQKFTIGVKFAELYDVGGTSTGDFKYVDGKTIKIPVLTVKGMRDTNRDALQTATRRFDNAWESKTLTHDRFFDTLVDPADVDETNMAASLGNITKVFTTEELFPEMDKYMASALYSALDLTTPLHNDDAVATGANVLAVFDKLMTAMDEAEVPSEGRVLYVTPAINALIKSALTTSRQLGTTAANEDVSRVINKLDDVIRVTVPSARMKSEYDFTEGAVAEETADQINLILVHPKSVIAPVKITDAWIDQPSAKTNGKYYYYQRQYWDVFVLGQRLGGVQMNITAHVA